MFFCEVYYVVAEAAASRQHVLRHVDEKTAAASRRITEMMAWIEGEQGE